MTDTPSRPKRGRWRWIVVGMLFATTVIIGGGLIWSRGDPRFVGTWRHRGTGATDTFHPNETGTWQLEGQAVEKFRWTTVNEMLFIRYLGPPMYYLPYPVIEVCQQCFVKFGIGSNWPIQSVSPDRVELGDDDGEVASVFVRVP